MDFVAQLIAVFALVIGVNFIARGAVSKTTAPGYIGAAFLGVFVALIEYFPSS